MAKRRSVRQPPIDRHARSSETRPLWVGIVLVILACACFLVGAMTTHSVEGADRPLSEYELNHAAAVGGVDRLFAPETDQGDTYCPT